MIHNISFYLCVLNDYRIYNHNFEVPDKIKFHKSEIAYTFLRRKIYYLQVVRSNFQTL